jgi:hypothetical protein
MPSVNFGAYGVGPPKLSMTTGWELEKSTAMLAAYWERNKAVKQVAADITVKYFTKMVLSLTMLQRT